MGQGDAKLAAAIGANLFLPLSLVSFFLSILLGGIISIALLVTRRMAGRSAIPFGPYLVLGAVASLFFGQNLLDWYRHFLLPQ